MEEFVRKIREELKYTNSYDNQLAEIDAKLKNDNLLKVPLSELRENLFDLLLKVLNDKQFKQKTLLLSCVNSHVLRDCQHWRQESVKAKDQLVQQLLALIEETMFGQTEDAIKIEMMKMMLEASCINANAIAFDDLVRIIHLSCKLITETHGRTFGRNQLNQSNECPLVLATYAASSQIMENFLLYYEDEEATKLQQVSIRNGYLCKETANCDSFEDLRVGSKFKGVKGEKLGDKFFTLVTFLIDRYEQAEENNKIEPKHFYLSSILVCLKCCTEQETVLLKLDMKLKDFLTNKFANFIFHLLDCRLQKPAVYFKLELKKSDGDKLDAGGKNGAKTDGKPDRKCFLDERLIKLIYLICEEIFRVFSEFRPLRPTLVSITFKMCSSDDNQFFILKCINRIFKNHLLLFKLFYLTCRNEILIDTSILRLLLDSNKKTYQLISSANSASSSAISPLASQSIANINALAESCNKIIQEFTYPDNIINYRRLENDEPQRANSYDDLNLNFENYKNKLDDLLTSEEESLDGDSDRRSATSRNAEQIGKPDNQNGHNQQNDSFDDSSSHSGRSNSDLDKKDPDKKKIQSQNVLKFVYYLKDNLPNLMRCKSIIKIDDLIQRLSSEFCEQIKLENRLIINADGIYSAIFCSLSLNYQLFYAQNACDKCDAHCDRRRCDRQTGLPKSEEQFIDEIQKSGLIVFLSTSWIKEIYQQLMEINLFEEVLGDSVDPRELINQPLIKLILDLDNQSICELIDYHKLNLNSPDQLSKLDSACHKSRPKNRAHKVKLMSELLDCVWPYLLNNLSYALRKDLKSFEKSTGTDPETKQSSLQLICDTLRTAEQLIRIVYQLSQTEKCLEIFDLFLSTILTDLDENGPEKQASLNVLQVIAMRIILKHSMQLACDCPPIWKYFFSCSNYISNMEHKHFTEKLNKGQNANLQKYRKMLKNLPKNLTKKLNRSPKKDDKNSLNLGDLLHNLNNLNDNHFDDLNGSADALTKFDTLNSSSNSINLLDDCESLNEFSFDYTDFSLDRMDEFGDHPNENDPNKGDLKAVNQSGAEDNQQIDTIVEKALKESKLTVGPDDFETFINHLCKQSTRVFEDSALRLNLRYLVLFLEQLISNSNRQLYSIANQDKNRTNHKSSIKTVKIFDYNCLLFDRFCDVIIKIFKSSRPIFHLMKSLQLASEHLIEAASFDYSEKVRKTSISTLNDLISNFLLNHVELPHFHFNETLFKSYETLLLLELCEMGIQEMIISSINGFVEGFENEIGSAWRSVFRALCGVRLFTDDLNAADTSTGDQQPVASSLSWTEQIECVRQLRVIVDIFDSFLKIRNCEVFNQGAIDCLNCLFKMLKKSSGYPESGLDLDELKTKNSFINLSLISLKCLHQFEATLQTFHSNEDLIFNRKANFYLSTFKTKLIDVEICELQFPRLPKDEETSDEGDTKEPMKSTPLDHLREDLAEDQQKLNKILEDWYVYYYYLHGLATSIELCSIDHQSKVIEILLSSLSFLVKNGHSEFGIYTINHIVFDAIQSWSNSINRKLAAQSHESDLVLNKIEFSTYKHFCIMVTNLVSNLISNLIENEPVGGMNLLVFQFHVLFVQLLVGDYNFAISTLSVSCLKHVFKESTRFLNERQLELVLHVLSVATHKSLAPFRKLLEFFEAKTVEEANSLNKEHATQPQTRTNQIADLNLIGKLLSDQENPLALESELAVQLLMSSYLNNQMELTDTGHLTKLYSFDIENENFTINKIVRKLLFIDFLLKEVGGLLLGSLEGDYRVKQFTSFEFDALQKVPFKRRADLIELIDDVHEVFGRIDKSMKIKFLIQKISMFKPLINFYQINSVCFLLKFCYEFDQLCSKRRQNVKEFGGKQEDVKKISRKQEDDQEVKEVQENGLEQKGPVEHLDAMLGKMIKDYIAFRVERKLNKAEEASYSEFVKKVVADSKGQIREDDLKAKLDKFDQLVKRSDEPSVAADKERKNTRKNCVDLCVYDQSRNLDFDTESYLIIHHKIIAELLRLQLDLDTDLFARLFPCFLTFDYHLFAYKNDDFTPLLQELLIKFDRVVNFS